MTYAAAVGLNGQRGQWLAQFDTPQTAMTHAQRDGRINRTGQKNDIDLIDLVSDHPSERKARALSLAGFDMDLDGADGHSIQYQPGRATRSVSVPTRCSSSLQVTK